MSYSIYLTSEKCASCGHERSYYGDLPDPTYNLTPIFDLALTGEGLPNADVTEASVVLFGKTTDRPRGLRVLDGRKAADTIEQLTAAIERMENPELSSAFRALEPANGWGTMAGALKVLHRLRDAAVDEPTMVWEVH